MRSAIFIVVDIYHFKKMKRWKLDIGYKVFGAGC